MPPPDTPPAAAPGGITRTMKRILSDFPEYSPHAISYPGHPKHGEHAPWVVTLQNFVSDDEVAAFIDGCSEHFARSLAGDQLSPVRTSSQCWCSNNACESHPLTQRVAHRIANLTQVPGERYFEPFQILKYNPGQFYRVHVRTRGSNPRPSSLSPRVTCLCLSSPLRGARSNPVLAA